LLLPAYLLNDVACKVPSSSAVSVARGAEAKKTRARWGGKRRRRRCLTRGQKNKVREATPSFGEASEDAPEAGASG